MSDLDVIRQAIEERDAAIRNTELLATEMVYHGNSVQWWHSKATAYKSALGEAWDALRAAGIQSDGQTTVAEGIRKLAASKAG
jgi:hypothetical protein